MVDSISDSMYGLQGISAYSIGSYTQIDKTDTEVFEDVFQDALDSVGEDTENLYSQKLDMSNLGVPAGMQIEQAEDVQSVEGSSSSSSSGSSGSPGSDEEDEEYDVMDLNQDGTVSSSEMIIYEMLHGSSGSNDSQINSTSLSDALSAYMAA